MASQPEILPDLEQLLESSGGLRCFLACSGKAGRDGSRNSGKPMDLDDGDLPHTTLPAEEPLPLFDSIVRQLTARGWLDGHAFIVPIGYRLAWSQQGVRRALLLQHILINHGLIESEETVRNFTRRCRDQSEATKGSGLSAVEFEFWLMCLDELRLEDAENLLWPLVQVLAEWAPRSSQQLTMPAGG